MFKLMKYEIRGTYKFVLSTILVVALAMAGIQYTIYNLESSFAGRPGAGNMVMLQLLVPLLSIVLVAASIGFIVYLIQSFRKELYEDRGYLTFTLPLSGKEILGAKFIIAVLWSVVFGLVLIGLNAFIFSMIFDGFIIEQISFQLRVLFDQIGRGVFSAVFLYFFVSSLASLLNVYFSITISKVAIKNRHIGGLWILIYIVLQMIFNFLERTITHVFPLYTDMKNGVSSTHNLMTTEFGLSIDIMGGSPVLSLSALIYWIILGIGLFLLTSYLIDRKIEL